MRRAIKVFSFVLCGTAWLPRAMSFTSTPGRSWCCSFVPRKSSGESSRLVGDDGSSSTPSSTTSRCTRLRLASVTEAWDAYNRALETDPLIVKSVTASVILGLGDLAGQALEKVRRGSDEDDADDVSVDWARAARFAIFGLVLQAPWNHYYYLLLDGQIPPTPEPFSSTNIAKVCIDQFIQAPIFTVLIFAFLGVLEGKGLSDIQKQLQNDYPETIVANCKCTLDADVAQGINLPFRRSVTHFACTNAINVMCVGSDMPKGKLWVPATIINIGFVPPPLRVLYLNCVFFFWSIYLSLVLNKEETSP
jgi:peroxisomal membrane protein 2